MALVNTFEKQGIILFKYRGQFPIVLFFLSIQFIWFTDYSSIINVKYYLIISIVLVLLGFMIRFYTIGTTLKGRFLLYDALDMDFQEVSLRKNPECPACGDQPTVTELIDYEQFCGINLPEPDHEWGEITVTELNQRIQSGELPFILDVREEHEVVVAKIEGTSHIPMNQVAARLDEIDQNGEIIVYCKTGGRSAKICTLLTNQNFQNVKNLQGGIRAWSQTIDPSIPLY